MFLNNLLHSNKLIRQPLYLTGILCYYRNILHYVYIFHPPYHLHYKPFMGINCDLFTILSMVHKTVTVSLLKLQK